MGTLFDSGTEDGAEGGVGKAVDQFLTRMGFLTPFLWIAHTVGHALAHDALVENTALQFQEEAAKPAFPVGEILDGEPFALQGIKELAGQRLHPFFGCLAQFLQTGGVSVEETGLLQLLAEGGADAFVFVAEDGLAEGRQSGSQCGR